MIPERLTRTEAPDEAWIRLAATGVEVEGVRAAAVDAARHVRDWVTVASRSVDQGLIHASRRLAEALPANAVPSPGRREMERRAREMTAWSLVALGQLGRVDEAFRSARVPYLVLKGPALAVTLYGEPTARSYGDLDLFVPARRRRRALAVLDGLGYPTARARPQGDGSPLRVRPSVTLPGPTDVDLDLHWGFNEAGQRLDLHRRGLWARAESVRMGGVRAPTPGPEDTVLLLAAHGAKHGWGRWGWLADFARLLRVRPALDGVLLDRLAYETGLRRVLGSAMLLAADVVRAPVSPTLLARARSDAPTVDLARTFRSRLVAGGGDPEPWEHVRLAWRQRERRHDRPLDLLWTCLNATDPGWVGPPPVPLGPLGRPVRALRLALREGGRALRRDAKAPASGAGEGRA